MRTEFGMLDWLVIVAYACILVAGGIIFNRKATTDSRGYFLAGGHIPAWLAAVSVMAASQSAATFLGAPDYGFRGDFTYVGNNLGAMIAAAFVGLVLIPRFYALNATTVYELLKDRYGALAMRAAGAMFLVGRVMAGGSRVYLGAIAVAMMLFGSVTVYGIVLATLIIVVVSFAFTYVGGLKSIIWNDLIQFVLYCGAAIGVLVFLWSLIPASGGEILAGLAHTPTGDDKLRLFDLSFDLAKPFSLPAILTGGVLLGIASFGLDQDLTQRLLASRSAKVGANGLYMSSILTIPILVIFIAIGELLYVFYSRPDLMHTTSLAAAGKSVNGESVTIFMCFILTQIPQGLRGLATVGVLAAAVATTNSALNAMSSVMIEDFYRPLLLKARSVPDAHFVKAGRCGMAIAGFFMFVMSILSFYWQRYTDTPLLAFVLGVMSFAYSGLLGVYFTLLFTRRGSTLSVIASLATGFLVILAMQPWMVDVVGLPKIVKQLAFPYQLCIGTAIAFIVCLLGNASAARQADHVVRA